MKAVNINVQGKKPPEVKEVINAMIMLKHQKAVSVDDVN